MSDADPAAVEDKGEDEVEDKGEDEVEAKGEDEVEAKGGDETSSKSKAPTAEAIAEELEKVLKINQGLPIVPEPAGAETIKKAVLILYNNHINKESVDETTDQPPGGPVTEDGGEGEGVDGGKGEGVDGHDGGRRRTKRKGRKVSRKSKKGGKRQHQSSKNGGRSRKYSRRRKH